MNSSPADAGAFVVSPHMAVASRCPPVPGAASSQCAQDASMSSTTTAVPCQANDVSSHTSTANQQSYSRLVHWAFPLVLCIVAAALILPFFQTDVPPVVDYPNHLAGDYILSHLHQSTWLAAMYRPHWVIIPNLASDILLVALLGILPIFIAGKLALVASLLTPLAGVIVFNYALFRRLSLWPLASGLVAFNFAFLLGLMNFLLGLGAAFAVAAIWVRWREHYTARTIAALAAGSLAVFFCHITALPFLAVLVGAYEIDQIQGRTVRAVVRRLLCLVPTTIPTGLLYFYSATAAGQLKAHWYTVIGKLVFAFAPVMNYNLPLDFLTGVGIVSFAVLAVRRGWLLLPRSILICLGLLCLLFILLPFRVKGGAFFDMRFEIMAAYLLFAGMRENPLILPGRLTAALICLVALTCGRIFFVSEVWQWQPQEIALVQQATRLVPPGSRVLIATVLPDNATARTYWNHVPAVRRIDSIYMDDYHLPTIFLAEGQDFFQTLFADPTQQPIGVRRDYQGDTVSSAAWGPPDYSLLMTSPRTAHDREMYPYLSGWQSKFDYVLVMNAGGMTEPRRFLPNRLKLMEFNDLAALFQVRAPDSALPPVIGSSAPASRTAPAAMVP